MAFRVAGAFFWLAAPSWSCAPAGCSKVTMSKKLTSCNDTLRGRDSIQPLLLIDCTNGGKRQERTAGPKGRMMAMREGTGLPALGPAGGQQLLFFLQQLSLCRRRHCQHLSCLP